MAGEVERERGILLGLLMGDRNGGPIQMALELASSLRRPFAIKNETLFYDLVFEVSPTERSVAHGTGPAAFRSCITSQNASRPLQTDPHSVAQRMGWLTPSIETAPSGTSASCCMS